MPEVPGFVGELAAVDVAAGSSDELLQRLGESALAAGYVRDTFGEAVRAREQAFPTGLPTPMPVAIPHVESEHVVRAGLVPVRLAAPLAFGEMGSGGREVQVELVVMLLVTDKDAQVPTLGALVRAFQRPDLRAVVASVDDGPALAESLQLLL